jgi:hypothetical protein
MRKRKIEPQAPAYRNSGNPFGKRPDGTRLERFAGKPAWITPELVEDTLQTWQPHYNQELSETDAVEILQSVARLIDAVQEFST